MWLPDACVKIVFVSFYFRARIGLAKYLANRFPDPEFDHNQISQITKKYAKIDDCPLLTQHQALHKWIGKEYYENITGAAYIVNHTFETRIHITYVKAPKSVKRGEKVPIRIPKPTLEQEEKEWKQAIALTFFNLTTVKPEKNLSHLKTKPYKVTSRKLSTKKSQKRKNKSKN